MKTPAKRNRFKRSVGTPERWSNGRIKWQPEGWMWQGKKHARNLRLAGKAAKEAA